MRAPGVSRLQYIHKPQEIITESQILERKTQTSGDHLKTVNQGDSPNLQLMANVLPSSEPTSHPGIAT